MEIWKEIPGYEGLYAVSDKGRIRSLERFVIRKSIHGHKHKVFHYGRFVKGEKTKAGYIQVTLVKNGRNKRYRRGQLVVFAFLDKNYRKKGLVMNHKNLIKTDDRLSNLEVVTYKQNAKHAIDAKRYCRKGQDHHWAKLNEDTILLIRDILKHKPMYVWQISELFNVSLHTINAIKYRFTWKHI